MAQQVQFRRGSTAEHASFTGAPGVIHDGTTAGGVPLAREAHDHPATDTIDGGTY